MRFLFLHPLPLYAIGYGLACFMLAASLGGSFAH